MKKSILIAIILSLVFGGTVRAATKFKEKIIDLQLKEFTTKVVGSSDAWTDPSFKKIGKGWYLFDDKNTKDISDDTLFIVIYDDGEIIIPNELIKVADLM